MSDILFLSNPFFGLKVKLCVFCPSGVSFDIERIGQSFYPLSQWDQSVVGEAYQPFTRGPKQWPNFLRNAYKSTDFVLVYNSENERFREVKKEALEAQNPEMLSYTFLEINVNRSNDMMDDTVPEDTTSDNTPEDTTPVQPTSAEDKAMDTIPESGTPADSTSTETMPDEKVAEDTTQVITTPEDTMPENEMVEDRVAKTMNTLNNLIEKGWTASAIARESEINAITVGNIKSGKAKGISDRVFSSIDGLRQRIEAGQVVMPARKRRGPAVKGKKAATPAKKQTGKRKPKSKSKLTDLDREIAQIEKQITELSMLEKKLVYLKKIKALQEEYKDVI